MFFSLGGAVAVHVAISGRIKELSGLIVLDVVEGNLCYLFVVGTYPSHLSDNVSPQGTALASLTYMDTYLSKIPPTFPSIEKAIQWTYVLLFI